MNQSAVCALTMNQSAVCNLTINQSAVCNLTINQLAICNLTINQSAVCNMAMNQIHYLLLTNLLEILLNRYLYFFSVFADILSLLTTYCYCLAQCISFDVIFCSTLFNSLEYSSVFATLSLVKHSVCSVSLE